MLFVTVDKTHPGKVIKSSGRTLIDIQGEIQNSLPLQKIELIVNGQKSELPLGSPVRSPSGSYCYRIDKKVEIAESSWIAVRCFQFKGNRVRFAHSAPWHVVLDEKPVRPRREEIDYLIERVKKEIVRNRGILPDDALAEFHEALRIYAEIAKHARD